MSVLVSIIVPIYNMEQYLDKCVRSILKQTYQNIELILVDDGSSDASPELCDKYAALDNRVIVIHKVNGGLSDARNKGLDIFRGDYVTFVDADDYLEEDAIKHLVNTAMNEKCQISHMMSCIVGGDYKILNGQSKNTLSVTQYSSVEYIKGMCEKRLSESVCDKLFVADLFAERRFEKGRLNEDFFFLSKLMFEDLIISVIDYAGYNYYQRQGSITNSGYGKSLIDSVANAYELKEISSIEKKKLEQYFARLVLFQARTALITMPWDHVRENKQDYKNIIKWMRKCMPFLKSSSLSRLDKIFLKCVDYCPKMTLRIISMLWELKSNISNRVGFIRGT